MPEPNTLAKHVMGSFDAPEEFTSADLDLDDNSVLHQLSRIDDTYVQPYKSPFTPGGYKLGDFQIGSVILPVAPDGVRVNRIRDVHTVPTMRGASIPAKQGEGVTTIDMTIEFPEYTGAPGAVNALTALIAEFKLSPFTTIRNRDLSSKVSQTNIHEPPEVVRDAIANIRNFTSAEQVFRKLFTDFFVDTKSGGGQVSADWQRNLKLRIEEIIADISANPGTYEFTKSEEIEGEYYEALTSTEGLKPSDIISELHQIFLQGERSEFGEPSSKEEFGEAQWGAWKKQWRSDSWIATVTKAVRDMILAARVQKEINKNARSAHTTEASPLPPTYIPVVLTRMVFKTIPGRTHCARVDLSFELFNFRAYVDKFEWHHYNGEFWTSTEDASEADLLLRWRDRQFLEVAGTNQLGYVNMAKITLGELNKSLETSLEGMSTGSKIPGYFKYLRGAWKNRRCKTPSSNPKDHQLKLFYPESTPQIHNAAAQQVGGFYRELTMDDGTRDVGVTTQVTVVWDLGIARQIDEFSGSVVHQCIGGTTLNVAFEVTVPIHETALEGDSIKSHEALIGRVNRMFDTIEQNRRILPSDAFMPTSVFVLNPITQMFGAYVFEAGDMPVVQYEPGCAKVNIRLSEAIPVVGLGEFKGADFDDLISKEQALDILIGIGYFLNSINPTALQDLGVPALRRSILQTLFRTLSVRPSAPQAEVTRKPDVLDNEIRPPKVALQLHSILEKYNKELPGAKPWDFFEQDVLRSTWSTFVNRSGRRFDVPKTSEDESPEALLSSGVTTALLSYLYPSVDMLTSWRPDLGYPSAPSLDEVKDPLGGLVEVLESNQFRSLLERIDFIRPNLVDWSVTDKIDDFYLIMSYFPEELLDDLQEFLTEAGIFVGDIRALIDSIRALKKFQGRSLEDLSSYMLYPDLILPTWRELLDIASYHTDENIPLKHLTHFIPSFAEYGKITSNRWAQHLPGRRLQDLADPDAWFFRQTETPITQADGNSSITYDRTETGTVLEKGQHTPTLRNGQPGKPFLGVRPNSLKTLGDLGEMTTADYLASVDIEQLAKPNRKRMLFAFPTYTLEFTLDGVKARRLTQTSQLPLNWEARFLNFLPVVKLQVDLDDARPNVANVEFISRRAALRNESWHWLEPEVEIDEDVFTNKPDRIREILHEDFATRSDPQLLTKLILATGTRVSIRMGYGTDLRNTEMLPVVMAGTIGEMALGEMSSMKIQDIGMQLVNPLEASIGATGNYSPNRIWSGKYTYRAFTDIFAGLDTKFMGRSGRGTEIDLVGLTDAEAKRIYDIGVLTRTSVEILRSKINQNSDYHTPIIDFFRSIDPFQSRTGQSVVGVIADKTSRFFPELLNVYPCVTGISDWAISNTDAKGIQATYWIDMLARLNPGCIWWTHPFGNESRLFFGRPEQYYRKYPLNVRGEEASSYYNLVLTSTNQDLQEQKLDPESLAKRMVRSTESVRGVAIGADAPGYTAYIPKNINDVIRALVSFQAALNDPALVDDFYRKIWGELGELHFFRLTGVTVDDYLAGRVDQQAWARQNSTTTQMANEWYRVWYYMEHPNAVDEKLGTQNFSDDFQTPESFASYMKRLASTPLKNATPQEAALGIIPDPVDDESLPGDTTIPRSRLLLRHINLFAAVLLRALDDEQIYSGIIKIHQVTRALSAARHVLGYRRFRQFHHVLSGRDLLTNRMRTSQAKMANAVQVDTYTIGYSVLPFERRILSLESDVENLNFGIFQWFKGLLGANDRDKILGILIPNALARGMARMYDGLIEVRGNQQIKPHDVMYILDLHNGIYGPVRCKTVMHSLDMVQGFVTRVIPELHTEAFSSRVLTEHVANQRIMKTLATGAFVAGVGAALSGGPLGLIAGIGLAGSAAALSTYASLSDTIARRQFVNYSAAETLAQARNREEVQQVMKYMMLDTFVSSNKIKAISPTEAEEQELISKMARQDRPELGVSIFPLMRFGSYAPVVAGLKTEGLVPIDTSASGVLSEAGKIVKGAIIDAFDVAQVFDYIGENVQDIQSGYRATINAIEREAEKKRRAENALRRRGVRVR